MTNTLPNTVQEQHNTQAALTAAISAALAPLLTRVEALKHLSMPLPPLPQARLTDAKQERIQQGPLQPAPANGQSETHNSEAPMTALDINGEPWTNVIDLTNEDSSSDDEEL